MNLQLTHVNKERFCEFGEKNQQNRIVAESYLLQSKIQQISNYLLYVPLSNDIVVSVVVVVLVNSVVVVGGSGRSSTSTSSSMS